MKPITVVVPDPTGEIYGMPTYPWKQAPEGLATRRQLAQKGLRKNGQDPVAQMLRPRRWRPDEPLTAYLYDVAAAAPRRRLTEAMTRASQIAAQSRQRCHECGRTDLGYIPRQAAPAWGACWDCVDGKAVRS